MNVKAFLMPFLKDRAVWTMLITWGVMTLGKKANFPMDTTSTDALITAVVTWAMVHFVHIKTIDTKPTEKE